MTRNLKALGLALIAVAVFAAISASAASAETKIKAAWTATPKQTVNIEGGQSTTHGLGFTSLMAVECEVAEFHSHISELTTSLTVEPSYKECTVSFGSTKYPTTVTMNGCYYTFTVHEFDDTSGTGQTHILCPEGKKIETHIYQSSDIGHKEAPRCTFHVGPQTVGTGISYQNLASGGPEGKKTVTVETNQIPITITKTSGSLLQCGSGEPTQAYTGKSELHATDVEGKQVDLELLTDN